MDDFFSVVTLVVASAALGAVGFAEGSTLMGWPLWASSTAGAIALIAGVVAFKPVVVAKRQPPRSRRPRAAEAAPKPEIPLPPVTPKLKSKLDDIAREPDNEQAERKRRGKSKKSGHGNG
jgi:hypothetical protein